jgi:dipeptidyl aminopeptidase/acylaminoacyl peptidase
MISVSFAKGRSGVYHGLRWLAAGALLGCSDQGPAASPDPHRTEVTLAGDGVSLGGILIRPDGHDGVRPAVIVLHGWREPGVNGAETVEARARYFANDGYVALALSLRGWPPSGGNDDCGLRQPDDVIRAVEWLAAQPGIDPARIGLVGFSQGGQIALLAGTRGAAVRAIVAYYPVTDVARWKITTSHPTIPDYITAVCEPGGADARSPRFPAASMAADVLLIHGGADTRVPTEQSVLMYEALTAAGRPVTLTLIPGAQHGFTASHDAIAQPAADQFLADRLR